VDIRTVWELLGHANLQMPIRYTDVLNRDPDGDSDPDEHRRCRACYERYAVPRDVRFAAEA